MRFGPFRRLQRWQASAEFIKVVATAVLLRDDVLDVVRHSAVLLAEQAILATVACPSADKLPRAGINRHAGSVVVEP